MKILRVDVTCIERLGKREQVVDEISVMFDSSVVSDKEARRVIGECNSSEKLYALDERFVVMPTEMADRLKSMLHPYINKESEGDCEKENEPEK